MKARLIAAVLIALTLLIAPVFCYPETRLVWNASVSLPIGLYAVQRKQPIIGEFALVRLPTEIAALADLRGYLPRSALLLKPIVAMAGDRVCRLGVHVVVLRRLRARALINDRAQRRLPMWQGCRMLKSGEVFLLASNSESFDSRYFGPVAAVHVMGTAAPIWTTR